MRRTAWGEASSESERQDAINAAVDEFDRVFDAWDVDAYPKDASEAPSGAGSYGSAVPRPRLDNCVETGSKGQNTGENPPRGFSVKVAKPSTVAEQRESLSEDEVRLRDVYRQCEQIIRRQEDLDVVVGLDMACNWGSSIPMDGVYLAYSETTELKKRHNSLVDEARALRANMTHEQVDRVLASV